MKTNDTQFDFSKIGKQTPYRTPDGYFEQSERQLRAIAHLSPHRKRLWYGIAAGLVLAVGISVIISKTAHSELANGNEAVYSQTYDSPDEWADFAEADMFLDNMDW